MSTEAAEVTDLETLKRRTCAMLGHLLIVFEVAGADEFECERCGEIWSRE